MIWNILPSWCYILKNIYWWKYIYISIYHQMKHILLLQSFNGMSPCGMLSSFPTYRSLVSYLWKLGRQRFAKLWLFVKQTYLLPPRRPQDLAKRQIQIDGRSIGWDRRKFGWLKRIDREFCVVGVICRINLTILPSWMGCSFWLWGKIPLTRTESGDRMSMNTSLGQHLFYLIEINNKYL